MPCTGPRARCSYLLLVLLWLWVLPGLQVLLWRQMLPWLRLNLRLRLWLWQLVRLQLRGLGLCTHVSLWRRRRLQRRLRLRLRRHELHDQLPELVDLVANLAANLAAHLVSESLQIRGDPDVLAAGGCWRWRLRRFCRRRRYLLLGRHLCVVVANLGS